MLASSGHLAFRADDWLNAGAPHRSRRRRDEEEREREEEEEEEGGVLCRAGSGEIGL